MVVVCAGCEHPIVDRFLLNVLDRAWHTKCVQCADCTSHLTEKCFSRDGKLYCREDFFRRFGTKCGGCSQGISPNDLVRRARNKVFHLKCFTCMVCRKQLSTGEELYVLDENRFICKEDYLSSKFQGSDTEDNDMDFDAAMLEKMDDAMSDKTSSIHDDDSRDSPIPLGHGHHGNGSLSPSLGNGIGLPTSMSSPGANSNCSTTTTGLLSATEIKQEHSTDFNGNRDPGDPTAAGKDAKNHSNCSDSSSESNSNLVNSSCSSSENNNKENNNNNENTKDTDEKVATTGTKRRGPRTTIKAKQLETLKAAFAATPKPTRHIREQLAQETGLNMRVIQVWFQNRRSKERRMKQLSALGARRQFFRNPRRLRALRPGEDLDSPEMMGQPGFSYFGENGEFYPGYAAGYGEYFPQQPGDPSNMNFLPPNSVPHGNPPMVGEPLPGQIPSGAEGQYSMAGDMGMPPNSSPEPHMGSIQQHPDHFAGGPPRSMAAAFGPGGMPHPHPEMTQEVW